MTSETINQIKTAQMNQLADYRQTLYTKPKLDQLFFELTLQCNEHCFHCGSRCDSQSASGLPLAKYKEILDEVKENFDISHMQLCITGGEPLLYPDFFELMAYAHKSGYRWGMTSNGTLITKDVARKLKECGMGTISISIDGLEKTHDRLRGLKGGYQKAMEGIQNLIAEDAFHSIMVTTVFNHENLNELEPLYDIFDKIDIDEWRIAGLEPIGRALDYPHLMLTTEDYRKLFTFIKEKRAAQIPVTYGCSHFVGIEYEADVRDWYFLCNAGVYVASIMANGDIGACLDIDRNSRTIQGNVYQDHFTDVWKNRFELFRQPLSNLNATCKECEYEKWCAGGAHHSWDYTENRQMICFRNKLF